MENQYVCDAWPVWRQTFCYLSSRKASPPIGYYQIILLGDRGTCVLTTCPGTAGRPGFEPATSIMRQIKYCHDTTLNWSAEKTYRYADRQLVPHHRRLAEWLGVSISQVITLLIHRSVLWRCWLGDRKGVWPVESLALVVYVYLGPIFLSFLTEILALNGWEQMYCQFCRFVHL